MSLECTFLSAMSKDAFGICCCNDDEIILSAKATVKDSEKRAGAA